MRSYRLTDIGQLFMLERANPIVVPTGIVNETFATRQALAMISPENDKPEEFAQRRNR